MSVIAVGGNKLARGITLEGLMVSYYLRTTRMYDSLMQMGRWFGYKPGYADVCRLFTTEEIRLWYRHVAMATEDMRADFDEMFSLKMKPNQYQLKVMSHPGMLSITSASKMKGHKKLAVGYSGKLIQTYSFAKNEDIISKNFSILNSLIENLEAPKVKRHNKRINELFWSGVDSTSIMEFISSYQTDQPLRLDTLSGYIELQNKKGKLKNWDFAIISNSNLQVKIGREENKKYLPALEWNVSIKHEDYNLRYPVRNLEDLGSYLEVYGDKMSILDERARILGLEFGKNDKLSAETILEQRSAMEQPLLVIYPLDPRVISEDKTTPIVGWGIAFPKIKAEDKYEYALRPIEGLNDDPQEDDDIDE